MLFIRVKSILLPRREGGRVPDVLSFGRLLPLGTEPPAATVAALDGLLDEVVRPHRRERPSNVRRCLISEDGQRRARVPVAVSQCAEEPILQSAAEERGHRRGRVAARSRT